MDDERTPQATESSPSPDLLTALLGNPQMLHRIGAMLGKSAPSPTEQDSVAEAKEAVEESTDAPHTPAVDGLGAILSDPAMLERLPQIIAVMKPLLGSLTPSEPKPSPSINAAESPALCREHLLLALKPFLSPARREAVDSILRISKLGAVFKQLK